MDQKWIRNGCSHRCSQVNCWWQQVIWNRSWTLDQVVAITSCRDSADLHQADGLRKPRRQLSLRSTFSPFFLLSPIETVPLPHAPDQCGGLPLRLPVISKNGVSLREAVAVTQWLKWRLEVLATDSIGCKELGVMLHQEYWEADLASLSSNVQLPRPGRVHSFEPKLLHMTLALKTAVLGMSLRLRCLHSHSM